MAVCLILRINRDLFPVHQIEMQCDFSETERMI
jgi:hypothetical protein